MSSLPLFDDEHARVGALIDSIDNIPAHELQAKWPQLLADIVDLFDFELKRQKFSDDVAQRAASKLVAALSHYFGGRAVYLATGDSLRAALRDYQLFSDWSRARNNIDGLAHKYRLTHSTVYAILRQQLALHRKRHQIELPFNQ